MQMATLQQWLTVNDAAESLGVTGGRVRQILKEQNNSGNKIGMKVGRDWLLSESDVERIRVLPDKRKFKDSEN